MMDAKEKTQIAVTISSEFINHVRQILWLCLDEAKTGKGVRLGINGYSFHALPAYYSAVAAIEAFINESLLGQSARILTKDSPLWNLPADWLEKLDIGIKLVLVPQLLFGRTFKRNAQPYQDMTLLIRIRNDLIHYKMSGRIPRYLSYLDDRGITLRSPRAKDSKVDYVWPHKLSCTEGVRWAHNTVCETVSSLVSFAADNADWLMHTAPAFKPISEGDITTWYLSQGIDPASNNPPTPYEEA